MCFSQIVKISVQNEIVKIAHVHSTLVKIFGMAKGVKMQLVKNTIKNQGKK